MAIVVKIGAVNRGVDPDSLSISESLFNTSTASFSIHDKTKTLDVQVGEQVEIHQDSDLIFGGTITDAESELVDGVYRKWSITCQDYNASLDRRLGPEREWLKEKTTNIFRDLMASIEDEELDYSTVPPNEGPEIERFNIRYPTMADAFKDLCSQSNYYFRIHHDKSVTFAPFATGTNRGTIGNTTANASNITARQTRENYANVVIVSLANLTDKITDSLTGVTGQTSYSTTRNILEKPTVTVNGSAQSVGLDGQDTGMQVYWLKDSKTIKFDTAPSAGASIQVTYTGRVDRLADAVDFAGIDERKAIEGGSGIYARYIDVDTEASVDQAQALADAELAKRKNLSTVLSFDSYVLKGVPGDLITVNIDAQPAGTYVIRSVSTQMLADPGNTLQRSFEIVSGNLLTDAVATFNSFTGTSSAGLGGSIYIGPDDTTSDSDPFGVPKVTDIQVTANYEPTEGGVYKVRLSGQFKAPADLGASPYTFAGVQVYVQRSEGVLDLGFIKFSGTAGSLVTFDKLYTHLPFQDETWNVYFASKSETKSNALVLVKSPVDANQTPCGTVDVLHSLTVPDVPVFRAGTFDEGTNTWNTLGTFDTLQEKCLVDWVATVPSSILNWAGVVIWIRRPNGFGGSYHQVTGAIPATDFDSQGVKFDQIELAGVDLPATSETWDFICQSLDRNGVGSVDLAGNASGPVVSVTIPAKPVPVSFLPPVAVNSVSFSVLENENNFTFSVAWVPALTIGGTTAYQVEARYFLDALGTTPISDWVLLTGNIDKSQTSILCGPFPKTIYGAYVKVRVRAFNMKMEASAYVESSTFGHVNALDPASIPAEPPVAPTSVSVTTKYGTSDSSENDVYTLAFTIVPPVSLQGTTGWDIEVKWFKDASCTIPVNAGGDWQFIGDKAVGETTFQMIPQKRVPIDCWALVRVRGYNLKNERSSWFTTATGTKVDKSPLIGIDATATVAQPTGFTVTVATSTSSGSTKGNFVYAFTKPSSNQYFCCKIERIATNSSFVPIGGAVWTEIANLVDPQSDVSNQWAVPDVVEYWQFRISSVSLAGVVNTTSRPTYNVTVSQNSGLSLSGAVSGSLAPFAMPNSYIYTNHLNPNIVGSTHIVSAAIGTAHIQDACITNAKIVSLDVSKLNAGTLTAQTISLNTGGYTTTLDNAYDSGIGDYVGIRIKANSGSRQTRIRASEVYMQGSSSGQITINANSGYGGSIVLTDTSGTGVVSLNSGASGEVTGKQINVSSSGEFNILSGSTITWPIASESHTGSLTSHNYWLKCKDNAGIDHWIPCFRFI